MPERRCLNCSRGFRPRPQAPEQQYCSEKACQRARRRQWQREKQRTDADYRDNQRRVWRAWAAAHGGYWCEWRRKHPDYCERNRAQQEVRDRRRRSAGLLAKMDASEADLSVRSGVYRLLPASELLAKMNVWTVRIDVISGPCETGPGAA
jgi:hypothetical protein